MAKDREILLNDKWLLAEKIVSNLLKARFPQASAAIVAGSFARGDATPSSDIDLVVLFSSVDHAWRETLNAEGTTVEAFCHDLGTLKYFLTMVDAPTGMSPLAAMIVEGRNLMPASFLSESAMAFSKETIDRGPPPLDVTQIDMRRYEITTALEDMIDATIPEEILAVGISLYRILADIALRGAGQWSGNGKWLPRKLRQFDPSLADDLERAMRLLVTDDKTGKMAFQALVERVLAPWGGQLLIGHRLDAPDGWRA